MYTILSNAPSNWPQNNLYMNLAIRTGSEL